MPALIALNGVYEGRRVLLEKDLAVTVGRLEGNLLVIPNDSMVSSQHCVFRHEKGKWLVEDLDSTNGTLLNGQELRLEPLSEGDIVTVGSTRFRFQAKSGETKPVEKTIPPPPPSDQTIKATQVLDYDEILDTLPRAAADLPEPEDEQADDPSDEDYYDAILNSDGKDEGKNRGKDTGAEGDTVGLDAWLDSPRQANMFIAMAAIGILFIVMLMFFTRAV